MAGVIRFGVVEVAGAGGPVAGGDGADPFAGSEVAGECGTGVMAGAAEVEQAAGVWFVDEPPPAGVGSQDPSDGGGEGSVACEFGGVFA